MKLTFNKELLLQLIKDIEEGSGHKVPYTGDRYDKPMDRTLGIIVYGSEGVGLCGNHQKAIASGVGVVWANECDPEKRGFHQCRKVKDATFGSDDGEYFVPLSVVKENMLDFPVPYIDFNSHGIYYGSAHLEDLIESPDIIKQETVIVVDYIDEMVEADLEDEDDEDSLISWRHYRAYAQVPYDFAVKEMDVNPEDYNYSDYYLGANFYMNPQNLWAKFELDNYGELSFGEMDISNTDFDETPLADIAVYSMLAWHREEEKSLSKNSYQITCCFNPARLPEGVSWDDFQKIVVSAFEEISPKSTLTFEVADHYSFIGQKSRDDVFVQFLLYRWIVQNRPELPPHSWLLIHSTCSNNCFPDLITSYYGWPRCEVHGLL